MALPGFWMSYVPLVDTSSRFRDRSPACMISVVLDADAYQNFSGIRLVIGHQDGLKGLENLQLKDCHEAYGRRYIPGFPLPRHNDDAGTKSYRKTLSQHRDVVARSSMLLAGCLDGGITDHSRPLCTIVFELHTTSHFHARMSLRHETSSATHLRIIYDRAVPCSVTERSLVANLELAHPYTFSGGDAALNPSLVNLAVFTHRLRVIPLSESRPHFRSLPADILHRIAWHAFSQRKRGFRTQLLSWGMVCKAWLPLLDLFYEGLGGASGGDTPDPGAVVRTLEHKPEKRRLIKVICPSNYAGARNTNIERREEFSQAFIALLELATAVRHLTLPMVQPTLRTKLIQTLCTLKSVHICYTFNSRPHYSPKVEGLESFSMCEIQKFAAQWPALRQLYVRLWEGRGCTEDHAEDQGQEYFAKLEFLLLYKGTMTGRQLLRFTSSSQPTLRDLSLHSVKGLSNSDLLNILLRVSPTLTNLSVKHCVLPRAKEDEEYAIDAAMSKMERLASASITGPDLASVLAIARKPQRNTYYSNLRMSILIDGGLQFDMRGIVAALEATGWGKINIGRSGPECGWDEGLAEETSKVVLHRHLRFSHAAFR